MANTPDDPIAEENRSLAPRAPAEHALYAHDGFAENPYASDAPPGLTSASPVSLAALLRYKWTMVLVALTVAAAGLAGVWTLVVPKYRATAVIEIHPTKQVVAFDTSDNGVIRFYQQFLYTQCRKLISQKVLDRVLDREDVKRSAWLFGEATAAADKLLGPPAAGDRLAGALDVEPQHGSTLISISIDAPNPGDAALVANAVVDEYLDTVYEEKLKLDSALASERRARERALLEEKGQLEREAEEIRRRLKVLTPDELVTSQRIRLDDLLAKQDELTLELENLRTALADAETRIAQERPDADSSESPANVMYEEDATWAGIHDGLETATFELDIADDDFGESHPKVLRLKKQITLLTKRLRARERTLDTRGPLAGGAAGVPAEIASAFASPTTLRLQIKRQEDKLDNLAKLIQRRSASFDNTFVGADALDKKLKEIAYKQELYETIKRQRETSEIERFAPASIDKETAAIAPAYPNNDPRGKMSLAALLAAAVAGLASAWGRALLNATVSEASELRGAAPAPFLGVMPMLRHPDSPKPLEMTIQSECIRMVRTSLIQRLAHEDHNVVQITSASASAGKTTFALMLARSLAQCGKRVLLVDADLRNPTLARRLGVETTSAGLIESLLAESADSQTIMPTSVERLSVLPAGRPASPIEAEMLANGHLSTCLGRWRERFDFVLLDSSPLLPVADARIMARHADGTILLAREGHSRREDIVESLACLSTAGAELLGTVLIGTRASGRYASGYYYNSSAGENADDLKNPTVRNN